MVQQSNIDLLITNGLIITMNDAHDIIRGDIAVQHDRIVAIGQQLHHTYQARRIIDAQCHVVMPGLINAHGHAAMSLFRGFAPDVPVQEWLLQYIFPAERRYVTKEMVFWGTKLSCLEMIASGTTTFVDSYYFEDHVAQAAYQMGMRAVVGQTIKDEPSPDSANAHEALKQAEQLLNNWSDNELIIPAVSPHSIYACSSATLQSVRRLTDAYGSLLLMHCAESAHERDLFGPIFGYLEQIGVIQNRLLAAHCVHIDQSDIERIKHYDIGVAYCPVSNMKLGSGIAPIVALQRAGVTRIGLGTDSPVSNNSLDMIAEMKVAALLQKVGNDPVAFTAYQAMNMATIGSARALYLEHEIGSLEVGKKADIIVVDSHALHQLPDYDTVNQLVYATKSSDVISVIINGAVVYDQKMYAPSYADELPVIKSMIDRYRIQSS